MSLLLYAFLAAALFILAYSFYRYATNSSRKLEVAHKRQEFYFFDDPDDARKNFLITYRGVMFEGEKYVSVAESSFEVVRIVMDPKRTERIEGLGYEDFLYLESEVKQRYSYAHVEWRSPIKQLMQRKKIREAKGSI
ncbi:sigma-w pathway protein ysdB [Bacillaceae bacterium JMAK1]|nr:sigma-w pathway protein ysdB [Bacillaceae bacterium JMAK1]